MINKILVGNGYDVHQLVANRDLILGGVKIPFEKGLLGHTDADVLLHAISDALIGAIGEGDIGMHFPDTSPEYKGISSLILLKRSAVLLSKKGFRINNIDSIIVAQNPKLSSYMPEMKSNISTALDIDTNFINIKATTTEGMGFIGRGEGISAYAVTTIVM